MGRRQSLAQHRLTRRSDSVRFGHLYPKNIYVDGGTQTTHRLCGPAKFKNLSAIRDRKVTKEDTESG